LSFSPVAVLARIWLQNWSSADPSAPHVQFLLLAGFVFLASAFASVSGWLRQAQVLTALRAELPGAIDRDPALWDIFLFGPCLFFPSNPSVSGMKEG
jgi:hypothetical protein